MGVDFYKHALNYSHHYAWSLIYLSEYLSLVTYRKKLKESSLKKTMHVCYTVKVTHKTGNTHFTVCALCASERAHIANIQFHQSKS